MFRFLGTVTTRFPWPVCFAWLTLGLVLTWFAPSWSACAQDDDIRFLPAYTDSVRGYRLLERSFPAEVYACRAMLVFERPAEPLRQADLALVDTLVGELSRLARSEPDLLIKKIASHRDPFIGPRLVSDDQQATLIQIGLGSPYLALQTRSTADRIESLVREHMDGLADPPQVHLTGPAGVGRDLITAGGNSLETTTLATILLVVVILLAVYRSPLLALIPLVSIAVAVWVALNILALMTLIPGFHLVSVSQVFAVVMLYGAGTDYCLFLVSRYREELSDSDDSSRQALCRALVGVGGALAASAGTVICGLGLMGLAEFAKVRCGGPAIAVSLVVALAASLTLTPALLALLGRAVFWPVRITPRSDHDGQVGLWGWISRQVVARPVLIGVSSGLLLVPLACVGLSVRATYRATAELSATSSSVRGLGAIQRHFTAGEVGPITVLLEADGNWNSPAGRQVIEELTRSFARLPDVAEVRSLTCPLGKPVIEPPTSPLPHRNTLRRSLFNAVWDNVSRGVSEQIHRATREFYLSSVIEDSGTRQVTRIDIILNADPFDPRSVRTLEQVQEYLGTTYLTSAASLGKPRAECYGITVSSRDMASVTESDRARINTLVLGGIFLILLMLVRRLVLAVYLLATVLLSYWATLGATAIFAHLVHDRSLGEIDWRVPFFLFTILVAVGEDYNILLISRALEERKKWGGVEGMRRALAFTGGTITSCGLIMAGTFATLMLAGMNTLVQAGFALAFGVLLDTFLVRPLLVPAFTVWLWREKPALVEQPAQRRAA